MFAFNPFTAFSSFEELNERGLIPVAADDTAAIDNCFKCDIPICLDENLWVWSEGGQLIAYCNAVENSYKIA